MTASGTDNVRRGHGWIGILLFALAVSLLGASPARADDCNGTYGGVIDGNVVRPAPSQINIDGNCTIKNFTGSNPLTSNISWFGNNQTSFLLIFDNVVHTGNMSCNLAVQGNRIWFVNSSSTSVQTKCLSLLIPVEKIDKRNPPGPPFASIGVPFTWTLKIPVLFDPATGTVINTQGSVNDLHSITITDDLNATGVDLTVLSHTATWVDDGTPVPHTFSNVGGVLTFSNIPIVAAGRQFVIQLTVVLNNTPVNAPGRQFINTAKWEFGRLIGGVFYQPLPGEWGVTAPLTIAAPVLVVTKLGPATMNLGQWGNFALDVRNTGLIDAWNVTLRDLLPNGASGGMCNQTPEILSAQVFAADGVTPVPGKGPLNPGSDYSSSYSAAPSCRLDLRMLTAAGRIGPNERLIVRYRTRLDATTQNGVALTNVAGAVQWFNSDSSNSSRVSYDRTLTNGTPGVADHEDAHTVTTALTGYFFEKTAANLTSGANPATTAAPGDRLRYTLVVRATDQPLFNFRIFDDLGALNARPVYAPGTLTLVTVPAGANTSFTSSTGGTNGTGLVDIRGLNVGVGGQVVIQFDITLKSAIANATVVTNQSTIRLASGTVFALSDDPNVNGPADPSVSGDEDPTRVTIVSAPAFRVQKISTDLTGDPNVLLAGETLRYTITVKNTGNADAVNVTLRDAVPANTTYVAGSTTLNGAAVADMAGLSALVNGMLIHPPADPTPGSMPADPSSNPANVATITFDVVVSPTVADGTIISNQGFVSAIGSGIADQPSDDPRTPIANDPTRNIVGNHPLLYADKRVVLFGDLGTPGVVDPGDVLRYTITVQNSAAIPATAALLRDTVPANTTYVANSTLLNGLPVGQPDGGVSPLASGINISSSDRTPPLPGPGAGTISPGATAVLRFDLRVNAGTPTGTVISNQAVVSSAGVPNLLTDGDGDPSTGPEPTVVVVGAGQQLSISKQVNVVGGGAALPGAQLEYVVRVVNTAGVPAANVVITDDLNASQPGQLAYVNPSATMNGSTAGISFAGSTITANYGAINGPLAPGGVVVLRFRAVLNPNLVLDTVVTNTGVVSWNTPTQTASASVSIVVGNVPGSGLLTGSAWHDADFDDVKDSGERALAGWTVELYRDNQLWQSVQTDANGAYRIIGVAPNDLNGVRYELRFRAPGAGPNTAMLGRAASPFTNGMQRITDIIVRSGATVQGLNLPIHPNGVIYNSMARTPVAGATLTLLNAGNGSPLPTACFDDAVQQGQITIASGYYKFDVNFSDPACPSGGDYLIAVMAPPGTNYIAGYSQIIPPASSASTAAFSVPACPASSNDAIPSTATYCEVQPSEFAPAASVPARSTGTTYYVRLRLDNSQMPGTSQIFNNHIPLDPELAGSLAVSKTTPLLNVSRGQQVPYTITVNNISGKLLTGVSIVDSFPAGFTYVAGSALLDGVPTGPSVAGRLLSWNGLVIAGTQVHTLKLLLAVGAGVTEGEYVNHAQAVNGATGGAMSGDAIATVRVIPDPTFDCTDVIGKVFKDDNRNGRQDVGESGLAGVRVVTARGLQATTDQYGRYHITCAIVPNENRGSNFVLKLDDRTLPTGFRMSTDQLQVKRATRGKALEIDFGASVDRVIGIDLSDAAFEPNATEIRAQWRPRLTMLLEELRKAPAVLRLSYVADTEEAALVGRRVEAIKRQLTQAWDVAAYGYVLAIEPEVFWRLGAPPKRPDVPESK
jgi:large repetitive protein